MAIRNLGAIIIDTLRNDYIKKSFQDAGPRNYLLDLGCGIKPFRHIYNLTAKNLSVSMLLKALMELILLI
ncbi:MAG: hypothetical protein IPP34_00770 [Bacteroidetes bacterium]|nr:hypothetical protein [Bacteroidota bacterium]